MIKSATTTPVHQLFSPNTNVAYEIPKYQREYSWGKEQWEALFDDLMGEDALEGHFLGTIIAVNKTIAGVVESLLEIVDGQQRLTTLTLLLLAVYSELNARKDQLDEDQLSDLSQLRRMFIISKPTRARLRLQQQNHNNEDFLFTLKDAGVEVEEPSTPNISHVGNRRVKRAYRYFEESLRKHCNDGSNDPVEVLFDILLRVKRTVLVTLEVESHADAFVLFESLNNRGLPLSPIDLIKNALLARADRSDGVGIDKAYASWDSWLANLGDDYADQERFFRQFYNAFKSQWNLTVANMPVATRSRLISIFEEMLKGDYATFVEHMDRATAAYKTILESGPETTAGDSLKRSIQNLGRVQGAPSYILLMNLLVNQAEYGISDVQLKEVVDFLVKFFVRRNLTNTPPTYALDRLFISIAESWNEPSTAEPVERVRSHLLPVSAGDEVFRAFLAGPVYEENSMVARFILVTLAERAMTNEKWVDLWQKNQVGKAKEKELYHWTIEHIVPQGKTLPDSWVEMLGGVEEGRRVLLEEVHRLGNLTITAYNSSLSNRSFAEKRDRKDSNGKFVGYKNGLELNDDLKDRDTWTSADIANRTSALVEAAFVYFKLDT